MELQKNNCQIISTVVAALAFYLALPAFPPRDSRAADTVSLSESVRRASQMKNHVVRVSVVFKPGQDVGEQNGYGFIIAAWDGKAFVATAKHVLRGKGLKDLEVERVDINFCCDDGQTCEQGKTYKAEMLGSSENMDYAFLKVPMPAELRLEQKCLDTDESIRWGLEVCYIGRGDGWYVPTSPGRINSDVWEGKFKIDDLNVQPGTSGAPLITGKGIIGMVTEDSGVSTEAITIGTIENGARHFKLPWGPIAAEDVPGPNRGNGYEALIAPAGVAGKDRGPAEMLLKSSTSSTKPPVRFPHAKHQAKNPCGECHHGKDSYGRLAPYIKDQAIGKCEFCHNASIATAELNSFKGAAHKNCKGCHHQKQSEGAPVKCEGCHT